MKKFWVFLLLAVHVFILSRLVFTAWPEMLSYPYLFSNGFTLYKDFIMPYPPGLVLILSGVFNFFGYQPEVLKYLTWILIVANDLILYLIIRKITGSIFKAALFFIPFIIIQSFLEGNMLWFDSAMVTPLLGAFYILLFWLEKKKLSVLFLVGLFLSCAVIIKQTAVIYVLAFGLIYLIAKRKIDFKELAVLAVSASCIFIPLAFYIFFQKLQIEFWNWVILYPVTEWSKFPGYVNFAISKRQLIVLLLLAVPFITFLRNDKKLVNDKVFIASALFFVSALVAVYPRFSFFHLQPALFFLFILLARRGRISLIFVAALIVMALNFKQSLGNEIRFYSSKDSNLGLQIQQLVAPQEKIFLLGLNSSLYVYANRLPPKNWSDNFVWYLEIPGVQSWVLNGMKADPPKVILRKMPDVGPWYKPGVYQPKQILDHIFLNYEKRGNIDEGIEVWIRKN